MPNDLKNGTSPLALKSNTATMKDMQSRLAAQGKDYLESEGRASQALTAGLRIISEMVVAGYLKINPAVGKEEELNPAFLTEYARFASAKNADNAQLRSKFKAAALAAQAAPATWLATVDAVEKQVLADRKAKRPTKSVVEAFYHAARVQRKNKAVALDSKEIGEASAAAKKTTDSKADVGVLLARVIKELDRAMTEFDDVTEDEKKALRDAKNKITATNLPTVKAGKGKAAKELAELRARIAKYEAVEEEVEEEDEEEDEEVVALAPRRSRK